MENIRYEREKKVEVEIIIREETPKNNTGAPSLMNLISWDNDDVHEPFLTEKMSE